MDEKLERLKGNLLELCAKIEDRQHYSLTMEDIQEEIYKLTSEIDNIKEQHEKQKYSIIKLLEG